MDKLLSKVKRKKPEFKFLMLGLDNAGKTTILFMLKLSKFAMTIPSIGVNMETIAVENAKCTLFDIRQRALWPHYCAGVHGLIFVVDCTERIEEAKCALYEIVNHNDLKGVAVLIFANKQDLPNSLNPHALEEQLELSSIKEKAWHVQPCNATSGDGLMKGLQWLVRVNKKK